MRRVRRLAVLATATAVSVGAAVLGAGGPAGAVSNAKAPATGKKADFDEDGYGDLAISGNGYVTVMYGTKTGLTASRHQVLAAGSGSTGTGAYSAFGDSMAPGDLDGDGYDDLVVGFDSAGASIIWGGPKGLSGRTPLSFRPKGSPSPMIVGDFDGDGENDLVAATSTDDGTTEPGCSGARSAGTARTPRPAS